MRNLSLTDSQYEVLLVVLDSLELDQEIDQEVIQQIVRKMLVS